MVARINRKTRIVVALGLACVLAYLVVLLVAQPHTPETLGEKAMHAAELGGDYLARHTHEDGSYDYRYDPEHNTVLSGYNMLRHAGTTYAMLELYGVTQEERYLSAATRALEYLRSTMAPCPEPRAELVCVYDGKKVKVGGNALAILAFTEHARVTGSDAYLRDATALAQWMKAVLSKEGEFTVHIQFADGTYGDHVSVYYPGEAIFALMRLHQATKDAQWHEVATRAATWLITVRDVSKTVETIAHDHWLLYGIRELYAEDPQPMYITHGKLIVDAITASQHGTDAPPDWFGGYYAPPKSTPTATRSEGLAAARSMFLEAGEHEYADRAYTALENGIQFQLRTSIDDTLARTYPQPQNARGGFRESLEDATVRIDYVQHNISALIAYQAVASQEKER